MKARLGFVSNSSSTSYKIINTSNVHRSMYEFVEENKKLLQEYNDYYGDGRITIEQMLLDASGPYYTVFAPGAHIVCTFGDEDGYDLGRVYDYILRKGGKSDNFTWQFLSTNR